MPFESESQRRWAYANEPEMAKRWEKKTKGDLPARVAKMTQRGYMHAFYCAKPDQKAMLHAAMFVANRRRKDELAEDGFTAKSIDEIADVLRQPLSKAGPLPTLQKGCGCDHKTKMLGKCDCDEMPMTGKADQMLDEVPWAVKQLMSQLPLEIQATELGGAGSTDIRPAMDQMNYENPARNAGECSTCAHTLEMDNVLVCTALAGDPAVGPNARCDLWAGTTHKGQQHLITLRKAKGGPFIGPRGGKWADAKHTIPWKDGESKSQAKDTIEARVARLPDDLTRKHYAERLDHNGKESAMKFLDKHSPAKGTSEYASSERYEKVGKIFKESFAETRKYEGKWENNIPIQGRERMRVLLRKLTEAFPGISFKRQVKSIGVTAFTDRFKTTWDEAAYIHGHIEKQIAKGKLKKGAGGVSMSRNADGGYGMTNSEAKDGNTRTYQEQTMPDYQMVYGSADKLQSRQEREASIRRRIALSFQHNAKYGFHGEPPEPTLKFEQDETVQWAPRSPTKIATKEPTVVGPVIAPRGVPLRSRSGLNPRMTMAGKQADPAHTDGQNGKEMDELMFFVDRDDADQYAVPRGLKVVPCDDSLAKLYGVMVGGYVIEHPDTRMFLVAS